MKLRPAVALLLVGCQRATPTPSPAHDEHLRPSSVDAASPAASAPARHHPDASPDAHVDLAGDVAARIRAARERFGEKTRVRTLGDAFVLVEAGPRTGLFDQAGMLIERALPPLFDGRFTTRPSAAVTVLLFPLEKDYAAYCNERYGSGADDFGVYRPSYREIAADGSGGAAYLPTLTHEIVHPIVEADFPDAPLWIDEAIASLFEAPRFTKDGGIHGERRNWRSPRLDSALAAHGTRDAVSLPALFAMTRRGFQGRPPDLSNDRDEDARLLHYAMARSFAAWLDDQDKLWPFYRAWRDGYAEDRTGAKAFERVMGASPETKNVDWWRWARTP